MKTNINLQTFVPNKKLIIHFDVDNVLRINHTNRDLFVYELCAQWVWGKLQKNSKEDPQKITGWKIALSTLTIEQPQPELISYQNYLDNYLKPTDQQRQKLILNISKGSCSKAKAEIEKNIKNITLPKTLYQALKQNKQGSEIVQLQSLLDKYATTTKYEILPAFYKFVLWLKKAKREFALIIKNNNLNDNHKDLVDELNLFFTGQHPLFNGRNGTPLVKFDGSKGCKNYVIDQSHQAITYQFANRQFFQAYGSLNIQNQKDVQIFKQNFKSLKQIKLFHGSSQIYSHSHAILAESACIYQGNNLHKIFIDPVDYFTHEIYFTNSAQASIQSCLDEQIKNKQSFVVQVNLFEFLKDVDYFAKNTQILQKKRAEQIQRIQKGQTQQKDPQSDRLQQNAKKKDQPKQSDSQYLKRVIIPVLEGALKEVTLLRPSDPIGYLALQCLKNKERIKLPK